MLPPFDEHGNLPRGIHYAKIGEIVRRFGSGTPEREVEARELLRFVAWARRAGVQRILINGSFVTAKPAPNDVDVVILPGADYPHGEVAFRDDEVVWPFLQVFTAADDSDFETWAIGDFGTDRESRPKGVVEVIP